MENNSNLWGDEDTTDWDASQPIEARELFEPTNEEEYSFEGDEDFDDAVLDIDFSMFKGDFKHSLGKVKHTLKHNKKRKKRKPLTKSFEIGAKGSADIRGGKKVIGKIIVPEGREVSIQGVSEFILSNDHDKEKNIGYYQGKKLKELVLAITNDTDVNFDLELFK